MMDVTIQNVFTSILLDSTLYKEVMPSLLEYYHVMWEIFL